MTKIIEAPNKANWRDEIGPSVFLAGGITNCENWQEEAIRHFTMGDQDDEFILYNPRRADFDIGDPSATQAQIKWEHNHLSDVDLVLFWFAKGESVQPITLYELGRYAALDKPLSVGVDPGYSRAEDVYTQLSFARPELTVFDDLYDTCEYARLRASMEFFLSNR